jgi:hypothetical protein
MDDSYEALRGVSSFIHNQSCVFHSTKNLTVHCSFHIRIYGGPFAKERPKKYTCDFVWRLGSPPESN